jgi:hypothetical protein
MPRHQPVHLGNDIEGAMKHIWREIDLYNCAMLCLAFWFVVLWVAT